MKRFTSALCLTLAMAPAVAEDGMSPIMRWYDALEIADVPSLSALIHTDEKQPFRYEVADLGITQNRDEFIASMAEWVGAISGGRIDHKVTDTTDGGVTAMVCYRFTDSELLAEEKIVLKDDKITAVTQTAKGDSCSEF
ncbi:MAG: nuclear transport factor 2 family protein [Pseudomonadota bacterium]